MNNNSIKMFVFIITKLKLKPSYNIKNFYCVILADVWKETLGKKSIHKQYVDKLFFKELNLNNYEYNVIDFDDIEDCKNYSLLSFVWNIK